MRLYLVRPGETRGTGANCRSPTANSSRPSLGEDIDIRHDLPCYRLYRDRAFGGGATDIVDLWSNDMVTFVIGCSCTFETKLLETGLSLRHHECGCKASTHRTSIETTPADVFGRPLVVSMLPFSPADAVLAGQVSARYPDTHGAPIHVVDPAAIGIAGLPRTDYGDPVKLRDGEVPPGCMLITDRLHAAYARAKAA